MNDINDSKGLPLTHRLMILTEAQAAKTFKVSQSFLSNKRRHGTAEEQIPHVALSPTCVRYDYYTLVEWFKQESASVSDVETQVESVEAVIEKPSNFSELSLILSELDDDLKEAFDA